MSKRLPQVPEVSQERRQAVRQVGGWLIFTGLATIGACGRTPLGDPLGEFIGDDDDDVLTTGTPTATPTATGTPAACECPTAAVGSPTGLNVSDFSVGEYAFNSGLNLFVCRDGAGFYAMTALCTHNQCVMGTQAGNMDYTNLSGGFSCSCHGSNFNANGERTSGSAPAGSVLNHFRLSIDGTGAIYVDLTPPFEDKDCRCPGS